MSKRLDYIEQSKISWGRTVPDDDNGYPGDEKILMACLQRIAKATELMAKNYDQLVIDRDWYKNRYKQLGEEVQSLNNTIRTLKGNITKAKKKILSNEK